MTEMTPVADPIPVPAALARIRRREARIEARRRPRKPTAQQITWYYSGHSVDAIARLWSVAKKTARAGLESVRAYEQWLGVRVYAGAVPYLQPLYGCQPFVPGGSCPHDHRLTSTENPFFCERCNRSFWDEHPLFWPSALDPAPVGKLPPKPPENLTRKQRRALADGNSEKSFFFVAQAVAPEIVEAPSGKFQESITV